MNPHPDQADGPTHEERVAAIRAKVANGLVLSIAAAPARQVGRPGPSLRRGPGVKPGTANRHHLRTIVRAGVEFTLHATKGWRCKRLPAA